MQLVLVCVVGTAVAGPSVAARITKANRLITKDLRYRAAIGILERVLADPAVTTREQIEAYRLLGIAYVARGERSSAVAAFGALLELDPGYQLDSRSSPKILGVFERARAAARPRIVDVSAIVEARRVVVAGKLEDPKARLTDVDLYTRAGSPNFERRSMKIDEDRITAVVDLPDLDRMRIDYYVVGRNGDRVLAEVGAAETPLSVVFERATAPPPPPVVVAPGPKDEPAPWYGTWWFWSITSVVVVSAAIGVAVLIPKDPDPPPGTLDPIQLP